MQFFLFSDLIFWRSGRRRPPSTARRSSSCCCCCLLSACGGRGRTMSLPSSSSRGKIRTERASSAGGLPSDSSFLHLCPKVDQGSYLDSARNSCTLPLPCRHVRELFSHNPRHHSEIHDSVCSLLSSSLPMRRCLPPSTFLRPSIARVSFPTLTCHPRGGNSIEKILA